MPAHSFGKDLVFKRFVASHSPANVKLFKFALKNISMVEDNQDVLSLIDEELRKMVQNKQIDVTKTDKLVKFKAQIVDFSK